MLKIDLHIHSVHSGHAFGTIYDIIKEAKRKKMDMIAITDHGPSLVNSTCFINFHLGYRAPKKEGKLKILWGCEANVIAADGSLDLETSTQKKLDIILAALHENTAFKDLGKEGNTQALINALDNPYITGVSHPTSMRYEYDFEKVCYAAIAKKKLLELNISYLKNATPEGMKKFKRMIEIVKEKKAKVVVNSDAHFIHEIGDDSFLKKVEKELGLNKRMIINNYPKELMQFLNVKK